MNPKEKAKELVDKFYQTTPNEQWINEPLGLCEEYKAWKQSKQCAIIAVDEILSFIEDDRFGFSWKDYYLEVKQEIEKL